MKFLVPNYSCLQNPWLGGYCPQIPVLSVLCPQLNLLKTPPPNKIPGYATVLLWVIVHYGYSWVMTLYGDWCESVQFMGTALSHDAVWALLWVKSMWVLLWVIKINLLIVEYIRNLHSDVKCEPGGRGRTCIRSLLLSDSCHWSLSATTVLCVGGQPSGLCWYSEWAYGRWL